MKLSIQEQRSSFCSKLMRSKRKQLQKIYGKIIHDQVSSLTLYMEQIQKSFHELQGWSKEYVIQELFYNTYSWKRYLEVQTGKILYQILEEDILARQARGQDISFYRFSPESFKATVMYQRYDTFLESKRRGRLNGSQELPTSLWNINLFLVYRRQPPSSYSTNLFQSSNAFSQLIGSLISVKGRVISKQTVKQVLKVAIYLCSVCGAEIYQTVQQEFKYFPPTMCVSTSCQQNKVSGKLEFMVQFSVFKRQLIFHIQDRTNHQLFKKIKVRLQTTQKSMIETIILGECYQIQGYYMPIPKNKKELYFQSQILLTSIKSVRPQQNNLGKISYLKILQKQKNKFDFVLKSFIPNIFDRDNIKKILLLSLIGGNDTVTQKHQLEIKIKELQEEGLKLPYSKKKKIDNKLQQLTQRLNLLTEHEDVLLKSRGKVHIFIGGQKGIGKSQIINVLMNYIPNSKKVVATGRTSEAGMGIYVDVQQKSRQTVVRAGVLVTSSLCLIDQADKMNENLTGIIGQVVDRQKFTYHKSNFGGQISTNTSIFCFGNFLYDNFNFRLEGYQNVKYFVDLFRKFDIVYLQVPPQTIKQRKQKDKKFIDEQNLYQLRESFKRLEKNSSSSQQIFRKKMRMMGVHVQTQTNQEKISRAKKKIQDVEQMYVDEKIVPVYIEECQKYYPKMNKNMIDIIHDNYVNRRKINKDVILRRYLISFVKLLQASAKSRFSNEINMQDFTTVSQIMDVTYQRLQQHSAYNIISQILKDMSIKEVRKEKLINICKLHFMHDEEEVEYILHQLQQGGFIDIRNEIIYIKYHSLLATYVPMIEVKHIRY